MLNETFSVIFIHRAYYSIYLPRIDKKGLNLLERSACILKSLKKEPFAAIRSLVLKYVKDILEMFEDKALQVPRCLSLSNCYRGHFCDKNLPQQNLLLH